MLRCICKRELLSWSFNFNENDPNFERNDKMGEYLLSLLKKLKVVTNTTANIAKMLHNIETKPELRKWFLSMIKKYTHKTCYGWQCKMKIIRINKNCKVHKHQLIIKSKKKEMK